MSGSKTGIRNISAQEGTDLSKTLLAIIAVGFAGAAALVGTAKAVGDYIEKRWEDKEGEK